jgi:GxxExxY protein
MTAQPEPLHAEITGRILDVYFAVLNELGTGYLEKIFLRALVIALNDAGLRVVSNVPLSVWFRGFLIGEFEADLVVEEVVLVEIKAKPALDGGDQAQVINYLRCSTLEVALLLNFGPKADFKRLLYTNDRKSARPIPHRAPDGADRGPYDPEGTSRSV